MNLVAAKSHSNANHFKKIKQTIWYSHYENDDTTKLSRPLKHNKVAAYFLCNYTYNQQISEYVEIQILSYEPFNRTGIISSR